MRRISVSVAFLTLAMFASLVALEPRRAWAWNDVISATSEDARLGAHFSDGWLHFGLYAPDAQHVNLLLFDDPAAVTPRQVVPLQKVSDTWRVKIQGSEARPGLNYLYEAGGPRAVSPADRHGVLFNEHYRLSDPYAYRTQNVRFSRVFASTPFVDLAAPIYAGGGKSIVHDHAQDPPATHVEIAPQDLILYELHVKDFTARLDRLSAQERGTYLGLTRGGLRMANGLMAGIDHLVELGVNAVELMPVMEYDEETGNAPGRLNHWGYMTTNFFAPEVRYASIEGAEVTELKQLVRALHERGIAVFLDVVYNHTGEGLWRDNGGRIAAKCYNLMCLALPQVYRSTPNGLDFTNATGTGNDVDFSGGQRFTKRFVTDSLAFWHQVYGIDGFRFDLARILADGSEDAADWIDNDLRFSKAHLHAEPWDLGGQWYDFMDSHGWGQHNNRWAKWVGSYRDQVRLFSQSRLRSPIDFKRLIEGYGATGRGGSAASSRPWRSINLVAVHDGYTMRDCTFFSDADGSQNCWDSGGDENLRRERQKLLMGILLTSQGVPIILQGDEFGGTKSGASDQEGARNSYNYEAEPPDPTIDNVNQLDWALKNGDNAQSPKGPTYGPELFAWTRDLIGLRKRWSHFRREGFPEYIAGVPDGLGNDGRFTYVWEGPAVGEPSQIAVIWWGARPDEPDLMVVYNESWEAFTVDNLGDWSRGNWKVLARSWFGDAHDTCGLDTWQVSCPDAAGRLEVKGRSMAVLISDND
jgi:glycogen operon protein